MSAWSTTWDMMDLALGQDKYVKGLTASVASSNSELAASIDELARERDLLIPALHQYAATTKLAVELVLKICGPYK